MDPARGRRGFFKPCKLQALAMHQYTTDMYEGMVAETVMLQGYGGDFINAYFARPLGPGPRGRAKYALMKSPPYPCSITVSATIPSYMSVVYGCMASACNLHGLKNPRRPLTGSIHGNAHRNKFPNSCFSEHSPLSD